MEIKIVIPTHNRAGRVTTLYAVAGCLLCVAESQAGAYRECYPDTELVIHPDSIVGLAPKRQWIYEKFGDVFMLDDDIAYGQRLYTATKRVRLVKLLPSEARDIIQWAGNTAHLCGCFLFGFNKNASLLIYRPFAPIKLSGFVTGCALGLLKGSRLRFSPESTAVEDFYISGLNAHFHRKAFIDTRFGFVQTDTFKNVGGQSSFRTMETERKDVLFLRRCFGEAIRLKNERTGSVHGYTSTSNNPYGRTLLIPF